MPDGTDMTYTYDGTLEGLLCCVFGSYANKETPFDIVADGARSGLVFDERRITTDPEKAERVHKAIRERIGPRALELVELGFLTCLPQRELAILRFLRLGFKRGAAVVDMVAHDDVYPLLRAVRHLTSEAHKLKGFVRFSVCANVLVAVIEPKNMVLSLLEPHFSDRFPDDRFIIYDRTHRVAVVRKPGESAMIDLEDYEMPPADAREANFQRLWKQFYDTVAIEGRYNPRCRMSHMPKRYWKYLTEMKDTPTSIGSSDGGAIRLPGSDGIVPQRDAAEIRDAGDKERPPMAPG